MRLSIVRTAVALIALLPIAAIADADPDVTLKLTASATITGSVVTNVRGERINAFRGIRYAEPPTGANRWKPSKLLKPSGAISATDFKNICHTSRAWDKNPAFPESEDCLFLNVYAPADTTVHSKLPVMVWTHGGGWAGGNGCSYDGRNLVNAAGNPVVVVTFNYRLGLFGFLANEELLKEGNGANVGLGDMTNAYQWVRNNIRHFGGNPHDITAFGESAGAFMVSLQLLVDSGHQRIFDKAILESGGYPSFAQLQSVAEQDYYVSTIATKVGCTDTDAAKVLACLRTKDAAVLMAAGGELEWRPIVDHKLIEDVPYKLVAAKKVSKVPTVIGTNTDEGFLFTMSVTTDDQVMPFFTTWLLAMTQAEFTALESLYPSSAFATPTHHAGEMLGDLIFVCPSEKLTQTLAQCEDTFHYRFNETETWFGPPLAYHSAEMKYIFNDNPLLASDAGAQGLIANMQKFWTNFARFGSPNGVNGVRVWPPFDNKLQKQILLQRGPLGVEKNGAYMPKHAERCAFWNSVEARVAGGDLYKRAALLEDKVEF